MDDLHGVDCGCSEFKELSRRQFIATAAGASVAAYFPSWLPKVVLANHYSSSRDVIVSIFQRGGADGLSICVPFADSNYYVARPTIAIPRPDAGGATASIALDNFFSIPQGMKGLLPAFQATDLLIVHATGQFNSSRSHFDAQRYMEVGKPNDPTIVSGWLGRHLQNVQPRTPGALLRGIDIAPGLAQTLVGAPQTLPIADPGNFSIGGTPSTQTARLAEIQADYSTAPDTLRAAALAATATVDLLKSVGFATYAPQNEAVYPNSSLGRGLKSVAALIKADVGIEAAQLDTTNNWDTHAAQNPVSGTMNAIMVDFANSLGAFWQDVIGPGTYPVTAVVVSEFGRNVRENGSLGTDHGRGTTMLALGKGIAGGRVLVVNGWPGLAKENLDSGQDLKVTVDYRDILAEIVQKRLENSNLSTVFPGWVPTFHGVTR